MKKQILKTLLAVCCLTAAGSLATYQSPAQTGSQKDREEQNKKIAEECEEPGREKPATELKSKMSLLCGKAISLPKPQFPEDAKAAKASGTVAIEIVIDEEGRVVWAKAAEGHELLRPASVRAACRARFSPMKISGRAVKASGFITYNFVKE